MGCTLVVVVPGVEKPFHVDNMNPVRQNYAFRHSVPVGTGSVEKSCNEIVLVGSGDTPKRSSFIRAQQEFVVSDSCKGLRLTKAIRQTLKLWIWNSGCPPVASSRQRDSGTALARALM